MVALLILFIAFLFFISPALVIAVRWTLWINQRYLRKSTMPCAYSRWISIYGGRVYHIVEMTEAGVVVNADPEQIAGVYFSRRRWKSLVRQNRLVRIYAGR